MDVKKAGEHYRNLLAMLGDFELWASQQPAKSPMESCARDARKLAKKLLAEIGVQAVANETVMTQ